LREAAHSSLKEGNCPRRAFSPFFVQGARQYVDYIILAGLK
jgi:hypothetical protein